MMSPFFVVHEKKSPSINYLQPPSLDGIHLRYQLFGCMQLKLLHFVRFLRPFTHFNRSKCHKKLDKFLINLNKMTICVNFFHFNCQRKIDNRWCASPPTGRKIAEKLQKIAEIAENCRNCGKLRISICILLLNHKISFD